MITSLILAAATLATTTFTDPLPVPTTQGATVQTPVYTQSFEAGFPGGDVGPGVIGNCWYGSTGPWTISAPSGLLTAKTAMTVEFWSGGSTDQLLSGPGFSILGSNSGGLIAVHFAMARSGVFAGNSQAFITIPTKPVGWWSHWIITNDLRYISVYLDGELYERHWIDNNANQIGPMSDATNTVPSNLVFYQSHPVDELRIYNRALTPLEARKTFENYRAYPTIRWASPSGTGTADGLTKTNSMSLVNALALAGQNVKIILRGGYTYNGTQFQLTNVGNGEAYNHLLIEGEPGSTIANVAVSSGSVGPVLSGSGVLTLRNLTFTTSGSSTAAQALKVDAGPLVTIDACKIISNTNGLLVNNSPWVTVQNCQVSATGTGVSFVGSDNSVFRNNSVSGGTTGVAFSSTTTNIHSTANVFGGQTTTCMSVDASSIPNFVGDGNSYGPGTGGSVANLSGTSYAASPFSAYVEGIYSQVYGTDQYHEGSGPEQHSMALAPTFTNATPTALDLHLVKTASGNPIDAATYSTLCDFGYPENRDPALWDATGLARPLPYPLEKVTSTGGNSLDPGAFEDFANYSYSFTLASALTTSAGVFDSNGKLVRTLWSGRKLASGANVAYWNGLTDSYQVAPSGTYTIKVLANNLSYVWEGSVGDNSTNREGLTEHRVCFSDPFAMAISPTGTATYMALGYQEGMLPIAHFESNTPNSWESRLGFAQGTASKVITDVATDGTIVYAASSKGTSNAPYCAGFISAFNVSDSSQVTAGNWQQIDGGPYYGIKVGNPVSNPNSLNISGVAVQYNSGGNILFVSVPADNKVYMFDKTSGAALASSITVTSPGDIAVTATGDLWVASGTSVFRYGASNSWATPVKTVASLQGAVALAWTPYTYGQTGSTGTLLVADGGTSQQVKAFRDDTSASVWTFGQAGGYTNNVAVGTNTFQFGEYQMLSDGSKSFWQHTFLAASSNGSFWAYDVATERVMSYNASRTYQSSTMVSLPHSLTVGIDQNNSTRFFGHFVEYQIDYTKTLAQNNGSWVPVKYYGNNQDVSNYGFAEGINDVATLSNNRTYGVSVAARQFVELTSTGLRMTGIGTFDNSPGVPWALRPDGSLTCSLPGTPATFYRRDLTGFDTSGNPQWGTSYTVSTAPFAYTALTEGPVYVEWQTSGSGTGLCYNPGTAGGFHLAGFPTGGNDYLWQTMNTGHLDGRGTWDSYSAQAGGAFNVVGRNIFTMYRGEFWQSVEANQVIHYYDDGLFLGQFGSSTLGPSDPNNSYAIPGRVTNTVYNVATQGTDGKIYLYFGDESGHDGFGRYRIDNLSTITEMSGSVTLP